MLDNISKNISRIGHQFESRHTGGFILFYLRWIIIAAISFIIY